MRWQEFLKRIHCLLACSNSQIIEENSQVDGKLPENDQGAAIKETTMISKNPAPYAGKSKLVQEAGNHLRVTKEDLLKKLYYDIKETSCLWEKI